MKAAQLPVSTDIGRLGVSVLPGAAPSRGSTAMVMVLAAGLLAAAVVALFAAPDRIEHVRLDASTPAAADAAYAAVALWADDRTSLRRDGTAVLIDRRYAASPGLLVADATADGASAAQAQHIVDVLRQGVASKPMPAAAPADVADARGARRAGLQLRLDAAERDRAWLSAQLTDVVRAIATLQAGQVASGSNATPGRTLLAQLQARRIDLAARYAADFPGIAITDTEIAQTEAQIARDDARQPHPVAALATLATERNRLTQSLSEAETRRDTLTDRIAALDAEAGAKVVAPVPVAAGAAVTDAAWSVQTLDTTTAADRRPIGWAGIAAVVLVAGLRRPVRRRAAPRRRSSDGFTAHVDRVAAAVRLPVLRCLDVQGDPLALRDDRPTHPGGRPLGAAGPSRIAVLRSS